MKRINLMGKRLVTIFALLLIAGLLSAETYPLFSFDIQNLEGTDRNSFWIFDFDSPSFMTHDGNWFSFGSGPLYTMYPFLHYYAEDTVKIQDPVPGSTGTQIECIAADGMPHLDPMNIGLSFSPFTRTNLVRTNLVNSENPWDTPSESGDIRTYSYSNGYLSLNGEPKLQIVDMEFEITTPYPAGAEIRDYIAGMGLTPSFNWSENDNIGPGIFHGQQGRGFGYVDLANSDPEWAELFAPSYKVIIEMEGVVSGTTFTSSYHDFEFHLLAEEEENGEVTPVVLSGFTATLTGGNQAILNWSTASETDMIGFRVLQSDSENLSQAVSLSPVLIPAQNCSCGAQYSFTASEFDHPGTWWFWLESIDMNGSNQFFGPVNINISETQTPSLPERSNLGFAHPNPFISGAQTSIPVEIKAGDSGSLEIYNLSGQRVASFPLNQGAHNVVWNGIDRQGQTCASGIYFYRLNVGGLSQTRKMVILK